MKTERDFFPAVLDSSSAGRAPQNTYAPARVPFLGLYAAKSTILAFFSHQASATGLKHISLFNMNGFPPR
jgi:hypothetical protein